MRPTRHQRRLAAAVITAAVAVTAALSTVVTAQAATGCQVTYTVTSQWAGGFGANVAMNNLGDPVSNWRLTWSFAAGQTITQLWNGTATQSGTQVTVTNATWNGTLDTGSSTTIGFNGSWTAANPVPADFALNGTTCTGGVTTTAPTTSAASPSPTSPSATPPASQSASQPVSDLLAQVHTPSRIQTAGTTVQYTWPGTYFEGRFRGTGVGLLLNDSTNDYVVQIDTTTVATLVTPGETTYWVNNLTNGEHTVRLTKRTESPWAAGAFGGLVAAPDGAILATPAARSRQIEFIGDSWTAGYGNMSTTRDCASTGGVTRNSNAALTFGALTATSLGADYQIMAQSGMGMVRNYNGQSPDTTFRTYYDQTLQALWNSTVWQNPGTWKPQLVVVGLGINDFSTALQSGERWATTAALVADYQAAYLAFLDQLRTQYGAETFIVLTYPDLSYTTTAFAEAIEQIVTTRTSQGDPRIRSLYYNDTTLGLDKLGCDWHPSLHDHQILASTLTDYVATLPLDW